MAPDARRPRTHGTCWQSPTPWAIRRVPLLLVSIELSTLTPSS